MCGEFFRFSKGRSISLVTNSTAQDELAVLLRSTPQVWALESPLQSVSYSPFERAGVKLSIKREDLLHDQMSGNKLYKLHGHLQAAKQLGAGELVSFGGYYSNHLHALAYAGSALGVKTRGIVRGHEPKVLSATLKDCLAQGMALEFSSRKDYRQRKERCLAAAPALTDGQYWIPEGGGSQLGVAGCGEIVAGVRSQLPPSDAGGQHRFCVSVGTGTTAAGMLSRLKSGDSIDGYSALKLGEARSSLESEIRQLSANSTGQWQLHDEQYFGGFAKTNTELFEFMEDFTSSTGIFLDPIYTAKMLYQMVRQLNDGRWQRGEHLVMIHTGGLQGRRGYQQLSFKNEKKSD